MDRIQAEIYARLVQSPKKLKTLDDVPKSLQKEVKSLLEADKPATEESEGA